MQQQNDLGKVHSHATFLHVLMHVASNPLFIKLAVLVSVIFAHNPIENDWKAINGLYLFRSASHMCSPLPLRNGTTVNISEEHETSSFTNGGVHHKKIHPGQGYSSFSDPSDEDNSTSPSLDNSTKSSLNFALPLGISSVSTILNASMEMPGQKTSEIPITDVFSLHHKHNSFRKRLGTQVRSHFYEMLDIYRKLRRKQYIHLM